jgi:hypothetical protein
MSSMLKFFVGFLLLTNVALFAYNAGYLGAGNTEGREPARLRNQLNPQLIHIVNPLPVSGQPSIPDQPSKAGSMAQSVGNANQFDSKATSTAGVSPATSPNSACFEIGNFDLAEARRFESQVAPLALAKHLTRRTVQDVERYIVYIPALADKVRTERKLNELRQLGVTDFYVLDSASDFPGAISLGVFKNEDAAQVHLAELAKKGVVSAKVTARTSSNSKVAFQLTDLSESTRIAINKIQLGFSHQQTRACESSR